MTVRQIDLQSKSDSLIVTHSNLTASPVVYSCAEQVPCEVLTADEGSDWRKSGKYFSCTSRFRWIVAVNQDLSSVCPISSLLKNPDSPAILFERCSHRIISIERNGFRGGK